MIAVIFEVELNTNCQEAYFEHAARLKPVLEKIDGFISVERFQSLSNPGKLVSLSFWRDEKAAQTWREQTAHRDAQKAGREGIFQNYRLRVASVIRDYGLDDRDQAPVSDN
jgi:heme-degrading monooxygenase HmoA